MVELLLALLTTMPGPRNRRGRPEPPAGYWLGYEIEQADRAYLLCWACFQHVLKSPPDPTIGAPNSWTLNFSQSGQHRELPPRP